MSSIDEIYEDDFVIQILKDIAFKNRFPGKYCERAENLMRFENS